MSSGNGHLLQPRDSLSLTRGRTISRGLKSTSFLFVGCNDNTFFFVRMNFCFIVAEIVGNLFIGFCMLRDLRFVARMR